MKEQIKITIIGLGYVGLPLARLFATKYPVVGFDINKQRIAALKSGIDSTLEVETELLKAVLLDKNPIKSTLNFPPPEGSGLVNSSPFGGGREGVGLFCSSDISDIKDSNCYIITVPTPVDKKNKPDFTPLIKSSETVGKVIKKGDIVIYESTVYPGATEEVCIPIIEKISKLTYNVDFFAGYSPERINPGDKEHTVEKILKVTSGSTHEIGIRVNELYKSVITAGTHLAPSIKVAEAAKVIENSQRDINIAFVNELAKIFNLLHIDTQAVLEAAGTKWNFLPFKPGLVGGHCIGVDPYYLAQKAQEVGYHPEIILAGRRVNDSMGHYVASEVIKLFVKNDKEIKNAKILVLGITFKENCPDVRNTKVVDVIKNLEDFGTHVTIFDPWANPAEVLREYGLTTYNSFPISENLNREQSRKEQQTAVTLSAVEGQSPTTTFDAIVLTVAHKQFLAMDLQKHLNKNGVIYDVKGVLKGKVHGKL